MAPLERVRAGLAWSWCRGGGQGVGRAIRLADDKTVGTIVIPVFLGSSDDHEVILDDSTFKTVWDVVRVTIGGKEMNRFGSPPTMCNEAERPRSGRDPQLPVDQPVQDVGWRCMTSTRHLIRCVVAFHPLPVMRCVR